MVKSDNWIRVFCPWAKHVNPNSVDLELGPVCKIATWVQDGDWEMTDADAPMGGLDPIIQWKEYDLRDGVVWLNPGHYALVHSVETIEVPAGVAGMVLLKSSRAREGWDHLHAGWYDSGFKGQGTMQIVAPAVPIKLTHGLRFAQIVFFDAQIPTNLYAGKYQHSRGASGSIPDEDGDSFLKIKEDG